RIWHAPCSTIFLAAMAKWSEYAILWNEAVQAALAIRKASREVPAASASVIQRGALPRPVQVAWVSGWRYFGAITRFVVAAALRGAEGARPAVLRLNAAAISSGLISYSRIARTISATFGLRSFACSVWIFFWSLAISFSRRDFSVL